MEKKKIENLKVKPFECPFCSIHFSTTSDLDGHFQAWSNKKLEHILQLEKRRQETDNSSAVNMAEDNEKKD